MKLNKIVLIIGLLIVMTSCSNYSKYELDTTGYGFNKNESKKADIAIDAYLNDSNLNNDTIEISYDDIVISEHILVTLEDEKKWVGNIVHYDNTNAKDEIIGDIILIKNRTDCFVKLYNEDLDIVVPADNVEIARVKYFKLNKENFKYK